MLTGTILDSSSGGFFGKEVKFAGIDALVLCIFSSFSIGEVEFANMLSAATGVDYSTEELRKCGERIWNIERLFNIGAGFSRKDDTS
jgi:aldehyde:ferredoxin oxidoreductase